MWSKKFEQCIDCNTTEHKHNSKGRCVKCHRVHYHKLSKVPTQCVECGDSYMSNKHQKSRYCRNCLNVSARRAKRDMGLEHTLESVTKLAHAAIQAEGKYLNRLELFKHLKITDKVWTRLKLSVYHLNATAGYPNPRIDRGTSAEDLWDLVDGVLADHGAYVPASEWTEYGVCHSTLQRVLNVTNEELNARAGYTKPTQRTYPSQFFVYMDAMRYIQQCGHQVTVSDILRELQIDYACTWDHYDCCIYEVHKLAGIPKRFLSKLESMVCAALSDMELDEGLRREVRFSGCESAKGYRLRFDFYVLYTGSRFLIEVDGRQHTDTSNRWHTPAVRDNDRRKNEYCKENSIPLLRISYKDCTSVENVENVITRFVESM